MSGRDLACVSWSDNPLSPMAQSRVVEPGATIGSLLPSGWERRRVVCKYNGRYILRAGWACPVQAGDTVEFHELVEGRNALRTILQIVVVAVSIWVAAPVAGGGLGFGAAAGAAVSIGGSLLINAFLPLELPNVPQQQSPGSVYNVAVSGNQARVDQAIPVIYGRHLVKPDYAGEPYFVYDENGDQIGYFLFCIGHGRFLIEQELIGRTLLGGFQDVSVHQLLNPGQQPGEVLATVVSSREVIGLDLPEGRRVGGFAACAPNKKVRAIGLDFVCPRGQGIDIAVQVTIREVDDQGNGLSGWSVLANETIAGNTAKPTRVSKFYELPASIRAEIRVARTSLFDDDPGTPNEIQWTGLRGYLDAEAPLCPTASYYELIIRASEQLSSLSSNQIGLVVQRLLRLPIEGEDGLFIGGPLVATRNPFHALVDSQTNADYVTHPLDRKRIDLDTMVALAEVADARQDRCDIVFDSFVTGWDAAGAIARTGRATPFRRNGVFTATRDQAQTVTRTAFDSRSILPGSFSAQYALPSDETPDGVIAEYFDYRSWDWVEIECPAPGYTVTDPDDPRYDALLPSMSKPERKRYRGITGPKHCEREGLYDAAWPVYRRKTHNWSTELQGMLPAFGSEVLIAPAIPRIYAQSGDVAFWDEGTLVMGLTEPVTFAAGEVHYIRLTRDDGSLTPTIVVDPGPTPHDVVLAFAPDFDLVLDDGTRERPRYQFGTADLLAKAVRITDISHQGMGEDGSQTYTITGIVDDDRVHTADNHLLPGPGEEQDLPVPGEPGGGDGGGGGDTVLIVDMRTNYAVEWQMGAGDNDLVTVGFRFNPDGTLSKRITDPEFDSGWVDNPTGVSGSGNWQRFAPVDPDDAAKFEVRATFQGTQTFDPADQTLTGAVGAWQGLGVERSWVMAWDRGSASSALPAGRVTRLRLEVREASTGLVQDTATLQLVINVVEEGGG